MLFKIKFPFILLFLTILLIFLAYYTNLPINYIEGKIEELYSISIKYEKYNFDLFKSKIIFYNITLNKKNLYTAKINKLEVSYNIDSLFQKKNIINKLKISDAKLHISKEYFKNFSSYYHKPSLIKNKNIQDNNLFFSEENLFHIKSILFNKISITLNNNGTAICSSPNILLHNISGKINSSISEDKISATALFKMNIKAKNYIFSSDNIVKHLEIDLTNRPNKICFNFHNTIKNLKFKAKNYDINNYYFESSGNISLNNNSIDIIRLKLSKSIHEKTMTVTTFGKINIKPEILDITLNVDSLGSEELNLFSKALFNSSVYNGKSYFNGKISYKAPELCISGKLNMEEIVFINRDLSIQGKFNLFYDFISIYNAKPTPSNNSNIIFNSNSPLYFYFNKKLFIMRIKKIKIS